MEVKTDQEVELEEKPKPEEKPSEDRLPNLRLSGLRETHFLENEYDMEVFTEPTIPMSYIDCPRCHSKVVATHSNDERFFRDINMYEKRVGVAVNGKRYKCTNCGKTFVLQYDCIEKAGKLSKRLKETIQRKALNQTFTSVAEEYGLSSKTVERSFNEYAEILNLRPDVIAPRVLGIDECHLQKQMRPVYVDIEAATILEMGKSVKKADVVRDLAQFQGLDKVEVVTTDMCAGYRTAIHETLPNALHIVDKFHVVQMFMKSVDEARKGTLERLYAQYDLDKGKRQQLADLSVDAYMFRMDPDKMSDWRFARYVEILDTYPAFSHLAALRKAFFEIYQCTDVASAKKAYSHWKMGIIKLPAFDAMNKFATTTFRNWGPEIFNYFRVDGRKTNATTERLNGAIKSMQNMGRGYSYPVLRAKMLFSGQTAKRPLYRRISKSPEQMQALMDQRPYEANAFISRFASFETGKSFVLDPCEGGGVWEPGGYYEGKLTGVEISDIMMMEYSRKGISGPYQIQMGLPRARGLELVENGGADIEKVIAYGEKHGECI